MDGHFVPNMTLDRRAVETIRSATHLPLDVHLMIDRPERYLEDFAQAGADWPGVHVEAAIHLHRLIQQIKDVDCNYGLRSTIYFDCVQKGKG